MRRSFDNLAKSYASLERLMFGRYLERSRLHGITVFESPHLQRALVLGEGDGRFTINALKEYPNLLVDSIERSLKMREQTKMRIQKLGEAYENRHRVIANEAQSFTFPNSEYDVVVVQYFLDCFNSNDANELLVKISRTLKPDGKLVYADFSIPENSPARWTGKAIILFLYLFFRFTTDIETNRLPALEWPQSLKPTSRQFLLKGLLTSEIRMKSLD